jgi:hypothetical protein
VDADVGEVVAGSFRDPAGFVFRRDGVLYRQVNRAHREAFDLLTSSGLLERLRDEDLLISHDEVPVRPLTDEGYKVLRPVEVPFVSYPYEWSFSQLRDAALGTLRLQSLAMDHGMSLRDASAYNFQFHRGRPVLIDTLSFEPLVPGRPWVAYRQFCQHFLAPLALMATRDVRLGLMLREHVDGLPLELAAGLLPRRVRMRPPIQLHLVMHAKSQARHERDGGSESGEARSMSERALRGLLDSVRNGVEGLHLGEQRSTWRDYYDEAAHYSDHATESKARLVQESLETIQPRTVWDLGANTGRFSRLASAREIDTVAFDIDPIVVDETYRRVSADREQHLLPLVLDLTNPSPAIGWANAERMSLAERGPADLVLALALVHHLAIGNNVPLPSIVDYLARLGRHVVVEFVPKDDEKVQLLLRTRPDIFATYSPGDFERALQERFEILRRETVAGSSRVLFVGRRRSTS